MTTNIIHDILYQVGGLINRGECITFSPIPTKLIGEQVISMKICSIPDCDKKHYAKGYCRKHYEKFRKYGDPLHLERNIEYEKHGMTNTSEYKTWGSMKERCYNKNNKDYPRYGGRGITVCDRWLSSFSAFYKDMGQRPSSEAQLDRRENDEGYSKDNCRYVSPLVNARNRSTTKLNMHIANEIRSRYDNEKISYRKLGLIYQVCNSMINDILNNKIWKEEVLTSL